MRNTKIHIAKVRGQCIGQISFCWVGGEAMYCCGRG